LTDEVEWDSRGEVENGGGGVEVRLSRGLERNGGRAREIDEGTKAVVGGWKRGRIWRSKEAEAIEVEEEESV
jgi:hypothetical protein